jgi:hypothetical protein
VQFAWRVAASSDQSGEHALAQATVTEARKRQLKLNRLGLRNILISLTTSSPGASLEYGRLQGFLFRHLRFAPLAILQNLVASVVLHPFPVSTFIARTQAEHKIRTFHQICIFQCKGTSHSSVKLPFAAHALQQKYATAL